MDNMSGLKPSENNIPKVEPEIVNETSEHIGDKIISENLVECEVPNENTAENIIIDNDNLSDKNLIKHNYLENNKVINPYKTTTSGLMFRSMLYNRRQYFFKNRPSYFFKIIRQAVLCRISS